MEELQTWWEVPVIAHFCYVFRAAFNLFHFEIEELEAALLQSNAVAQPCASVEQLMMRLLQGCCKKKGVNTENWEEMFRLQLEKYQTHSNNQHLSFSKEQTPFSFLQLREKIELLLTLCEMRLDADDVAEAIKGIESESLRVEPLGTDSKENIYWYFFGVRLYKEDVKRKEELLKQTKASSKGRAKKNNTQRVNGAGKSALSSSRRSSRTLLKEAEANTPVWSVVCHSLEDWNALSASLCKSHVLQEKQLGKKLLNQYIPTLSQVHVERERLKRIRQKELGPVRSSARILSVRERQLATARELEQKNDQRTMKSDKTNDDGLELTAKRAAEKNKAIEERAKRAKLRELRLQESENSDSCDTYNRMFEYQSQVQNGVRRNSAGSSTDSSNSAMASDSENEESCEQSGVNTENGESEQDSENEEEEDDDDDSSGSDVSFTLHAPRSQQKHHSKFVHVPRVSHAQSQTSTLQQQNIMTVPLLDALQKKDYPPRNFQQVTGLQLNHGNVKASITYHNFNTYSHAKPTVYQTSAEQKFMKLTDSPTVITFSHMKNKLHDALN